jgi:L-aminopeptidase/D-esterase-like protein
MQPFNLSRRRFLGSVGGASALAAVPTLIASAQRPSPPAAGSLTDVGGVRVGHFTHSSRPTGCTAILFDRPVTAGADYAGSAPGESLGLMLQPASPVDQIHAVLLSGGGVMAIGVTAGVVRFLEERRVGFDWGVPNVRVPLVIGAVIDDLAVGDGRIRVGPDDAYRACQSASAASVAEGSVGAGAGATVGKLFVSRGLSGMKGGVGSASARRGRVVIGALVVVNCAGDVIDWRQGNIVAGARTADGRAFARTVDVLRSDLAATPAADAAPARDSPRATTLTLVATNVALTKTQLTKIAIVANTGAARAINPYQTQSDGDQVLAFSTGELNIAASMTALGAVAAEVVADAIVRAVRTATSVPGWIAVKDLDGR